MVSDTFATEIIECALDNAWDDGWAGLVVNVSEGLAPVVAWDLRMSVVNREEARQAKSSAEQQVDHWVTLARGAQTSALFRASTPVFQKINLWPEARTDLSLIKA
ncbi:MAG: hypothetical protein EXS31_09220 [Pedosphaera sp.]|nr:hypothetical protein [Pedosphaera sp.]